MESDPDSALATVLSHRPDSPGEIVRQDSGNSPPSLKGSEQSPISSSLSRDVPVEHHTGVARDVKLEESEWTIEQADLRLAALAATSEPDRRIEEYATPGWTVFDTAR